MFLPVIFGMMGSEWVKTINICIILKQILMMLVVQYLIFAEFNVWQKSCYMYATLCSVLMSCTIPACLSIKNYNVF